MLSCDDDGINYIKCVQFNWMWILAESVKAQRK